MVGAPGCGRRLEVVAEAKLHAPRCVLHRAVRTQIALCKSLAQIDSIRVEADAVGDVEDFPVEFESSVLFELPGLGQTGIDAEGSVAAEVVAFPGVSGIRKTDRTTRGRTGINGGWGSKDLRGAVQDVLLHLYLAGGNTIASNLPVGGPAGLKKAEGQAAGPAIDARPLPSPEKDVGESVRGRQILPPLSEGQLIDPVRDDQVTDVEVGVATAQVRLPGVGDVAEVASIAVELRTALGVGAHINGIRECVAEIESETVSGRMVQDQLTSVVIAHPPRGEDVE